MDDLTHIRPPAALAKILERTRDLRFEMASEDRTGALLRTLAASKAQWDKPPACPEASRRLTPRGAARFLELGTGTGVATAWILDGMDAASRLISIDVSLTYQQVARDTLGHDPRLTLVTEDALAFLEKQPAASFDFVYADALRGKYTGLDQALRVVKHGGFYIIDDMLPQSNWPDNHDLKVKSLLETLAARRDFIITPMAWASGLVVAVRI